MNKSRRFGVSEFSSTTRSGEIQEVPPLNPVAKFWVGVLTAAIVLLVIFLIGSAFMQPVVHTTL